MMRRATIVFIALLLTTMCGVHSQGEPGLLRRRLQQRSGAQEQHGFNNDQMMMRQQNLMQQQQQQGASLDQHSSYSMQNGGFSAQGSSSTMQRGGSLQNEGGSLSQSLVPGNSIGGQAESSSSNGEGISQSVAMQGGSSSNADSGSSYQADVDQSPGMMQSGTYQNGADNSQAFESSQSSQSDTNYNDNARGASGSLRDSLMEQHDVVPSGEGYGSSANIQGQQQQSSVQLVGGEEGDSSSMTYGGDEMMNFDGGSLTSSDNDQPVMSNDNGHSAQPLGSSNGDINGGEGDGSGDMMSPSYGSSSIQGQQGYGASGAGEVAGYGETEAEPNQQVQLPGTVKYPEKVEGYSAGGPSSSNIASAGAYSNFQSTSSSDYANVGATDGQGYEMNDPMTTPRHGKFNTPEEDANCQPLQPKEMQVSPTWISSFPGSGSKMTWQSIEAITGLFTGDDLDSRGKVSKGVAVAIKTHYPSHTQENVFRQKKFDGISRGILVLRNPLLAIPAIFRFVYFVEQGNERKSKSEQPPRKAWIGWRNEYLESELKLWVDHAQFWLDNYKRENLHLLPFEFLVSPERGSDELQKVGNFLGSADPNIASSLLAPEKFCCVWEKLVDHEENDGSLTKAPPYTAEQLEMMIQALVKLRNKNKSFPEFHTLMDNYIGDIVEAKKSVIAQSKY